MAMGEIKPDPDAVMAEGGVEDDIYEDAGDLDYYDPNIPGNPYGSMYLVRIPKWLWQAWDKFSDDEEITIGQVRQWSEPTANGQQKFHMKLLLNDKLSQHQGIPKEHKLDMDASSVIIDNTFAFTEANLPGYKSRGKAGGQFARTKEQRDAVEKPKWEKGKKRQPYYRKAIPKKTAIHGKLLHELQCLPEQNAEYDHFMKVESEKMLKPKAQTNLIGSDGSSAPPLHLPGAALAQNTTFTNLVRNPIPAGKKTKKQDLKSARLPENELLDLIFDAFRTHQYWSMKAMRQRVPQPETYLRVTMERIANLHKSGRFNNHWELKPEYHAHCEGAVADAAPDAGDAAKEEEEDDDDEEMEDVA